MKKLNALIEERLKANTLLVPLYEQFRDHLAVLGDKCVVQMYVTSFSVRFPDTVFHVSVHLDESGDVPTALVSTSFNGAYDHEQLCHLPQSGWVTVDGNPLTSEILENILLKLFDGVYGMELGDEA